MRNPFNNEEVHETGLAVVQTNAVANVNKFADMGFDLSVDMTTAQTSFSSLQATTDEEKAKLFNAINNPEKRLSDCINMTLKVKDLYIEVVNCTNEETGEVTACPRIVIIDDKGVSYQAVSLGIYSALKKVIQIFGVPTWEKPILMEVKQVTKGNRKMLTLNIATK